MPAGCGSASEAGPDRPAGTTERLSGPEQSGACQSARGAVAAMKQSPPPGFDEAAAAELERQVEQLCREGFPVAPTAPPPSGPPSRGCHALEPDRPRVPLRGGTAAPPARPVPFFAPRAGRLPATGTPLVGGVRLPRGSRCLHHWATDEPVRDPARLAARLAAVFEQTGLWPVLWDLDDPDRYMNATGDPDAAARLEADEVLERNWSAYRLGGRFGRFPGLAEGSPGDARGAVADDPFGTRARFATDYAQSMPSFLLLVPAHRPADSLSVLGAELTEVMSDDDMTAVLRSWEERFGAVLTSIMPVEMVVDRPPQTAGDALRLAAEQAAFAPEDELLFEAADGLRGIADLLRSGDTPGIRSRDYWVFSFPD